MGFSFSPKLAVAILTLWAATVHSHIVMIEPPADFPAGTDKQAPLLEDGSDYPCKFRGGFIPSLPPAQLNIGANTLRLQGGATHGGGSCQISLTNAQNVNKDTKWQVIQSIEGGCPVEGEGNLSDSATTPLPAIPYTIPDSIAPGTYTLAWTWFNRIGNREMYMNCAQVNIGGQARAKRQIAKITKKRQSALPDLFRANIGNGCTTTETVSVKFPDPGTNVRTTGRTELLVCPGAVPSSSGGAGAGTNGTAGTDVPATDASANDTPTDAPTNDTPTYPAADGAAGAGDGSDDTVAIDAPANDTPTEVPANDTPVFASGELPAVGQPCPGQEGASVRSADGKSLRRCSSGYVQNLPMAEGEPCEPGQDKFKPKKAAIKRGARFGTEHIARSRKTTA